MLLAFVLGVTYVSLAQTTDSTQKPKQLIHGNTGEKELPKELKQKQLSDTPTILNKDSLQQLNTSTRKECAPKKKRKKNPGY